MNRIPNVWVETHDGRRVRFYDDLIKGKLVTLNMMYATCDGICPTMNQNLLRVQKLLGPRVGRDVFMYSLTLKPQEDRPQQLREYAESLNARPGWTFLTGTPDDLEVLRRGLGFVDPDPKLDATKSEHTGVVRYGYEPLDRWAACPALARPEQIVRQILSLHPDAVYAAGGVR